MKTADLSRKDRRSHLLQRESQVRGLAVSEAKRLRMLEDENRKLKISLADSTLDNAALKELPAKSSRARCEARSCRSLSWRAGDEAWRRA